MRSKKKVRKIMTIGKANMFKTNLRMKINKYTNKQHMHTNTVIQTQLHKHSNTMDRKLVRWVFPAVCLCLLSNSEVLQWLVAESKKAKLVDEGNIW